MAARVLLREITNDEGNRLLRIVRRSSGSVVTWRRARSCCFPRRACPRLRSARTSSATGDTVREVIHNFNRCAPRAKPKRIRATCKRPHGVRHLISAYDVGADRLCGHIKKRKDRAHFPELCRYIRSLYPATTRLHFILDNFRSPPRQADARLGDREQRRTGLHPALRLLAHRGAISSAAVLHARWHRPPRPWHPGEACVDIFAVRQKHTWPPIVAAHDSWRAPLAKLARTASHRRHRRSRSGSATLIAAIEA
jgi:hypothetical protein